ncbi:hypothetical protein BH10PSE6_BH10PSE6_05000 [soil metagenome]
MTIEDQLATAGYARVVVVLKPTKRHRVDGRLTVALDETISLQQEAAQSLESCFRRIKASRTVQMELEIAATLQPTIRSLLAAEPAPATYVLDARAEVVPQSSAVRYFPNLGIMMGTVDRAGLAKLRKNTDEVAQLFSPPEMSLIHPTEDDGAALAEEEGISWALERMGIPKLWDDGLTGDGVLIGHLDTGIDGAHPALAGAIDAAAVFDEIGRQLTVATPTVDTGFHGTHTAGLLVGQPFKNVTFGVAPGARLATATVIEDGDIPLRVVAGLDWCLGQGVKIVNLSLGVRIFDPLVAALVKQLRDRDVLPVVAIGNEGPESSRTPGNLPEALSVGAMDQADQIWHKSSSQRFNETPARIVPTLIGPGTGIVSAAPNEKLKKLSGTSMAAPHISGLAALLKQYRPEVAMAEIEKVILASCTRPGGISTLRGNKGVPDAVVAKSKL